MSDMQLHKGAHQRQINLSVIILTLNEQERIQRCIASLPKGAEVIVFDSCSTDKTLVIAEQLGAVTFTRAFTNYAEQRNEALKKASRAWVLMVDADEYLNQDLKAYLENQFEYDGSSNRFDAYAIKRRLIFLGRKMRWGKSADRPIRLFKRGELDFVGDIHEAVNTPKHKCGTISQGLLWHESYTDLSDYFARFNRYTTAIAKQHYQRSSRLKASRFVAHLLRPWIEFITRYVFRLGFLDGYAGYTYALISSLYAYVKYAKLYELASGQQKEEG